MNSKIAKTTIPIAVGGRLSFNPNEIVMLEADINYTNLFLTNGRKVVVAYHLKKLEERLESTACFFRANRGTLLNFNFVEGFANNYLQIGSQQVAVSRRREQVLQILQHFNAD